MANVTTSTYLTRVLNQTTLPNSTPQHRRSIIDAATNQHLTHRANGRTNKHKLTRPTTSDKLRITARCRFIVVLRLLRVREPAKQTPRTRVHTHTRTHAHTHTRTHARTHTHCSTRFGRDKLQRRKNPGKCCSGVAMVLQYYSVPVAVFQWCFSVVAVVWQCVRVL